VDKKLKGVIPPIATPFSKGETDIKALTANLGRWNRTGLAGYLVAGSNGESVYLEEDETDRLIAAAKEAAAPGKLIMAGTGRESTRATIAATQRAARLGADCALAITPHYYKSQMTPPRLIAHFQEVAEAAEIPVLVYNFPQATGINLEPETVAALAEHPNIAGLKDSSGNIGQLSRIIDMTPDDFAVFVGNAEVFYPALCLGAVGGILAVSGCAPEHCVAIQLAMDAGYDGESWLRNYRGPQGSVNLFVRDAVARNPATDVLQFQSTR